MSIALAFDSFGRLSLTEKLQNGETRTYFYKNLSPFHVRRVQFFIKNGFRGRLFEYLAPFLVDKRETAPKKDQKLLQPTLFDQK